MRHRLWLLVVSPRHPAPETCTPASVPRTIQHHGTHSELRCEFCPAAEISATLYINELAARRCHYPPVAQRRVLVRRSVQATSLPAAMAEGAQGAAGVGLPTRSVNPCSTAEQTRNLQPAVRHPAHGVRDRHQETLNLADAEDHGQSGPLARIIVQLERDAAQRIKSLRGA